jgi:tRNA-specific 2-thiouridylase
MAGARVVVAMSGGVDSSVAAALLRDAGYDVVGVSMLLAAQPAASVRAGQGCCSLEDFRDARLVAERLAIPYYVWNLVDTFRAKVQDVFVREYVRGRTPNPCVLCNQDLKFDELWRRAGALGADFVATGHYARIVTAADGRPRLMRARDLAKDQSYFLFGLSPAQLARTLFPLGELTKDEVRAVARRLGLGVADKPESQEICFVPDRDYAGFVERRTEASPPSPGAIVDESGQVVARHGGVHRFTVGQRRGLGLSGGAARYVTAIDAETATVHVGGRSRLLAAGLVAERVRWMGPPVADADVRIRHRHVPVAACLRLVDGDRTDGNRADGDRVEARFAQPVPAVTPGQAVVFYQGDEVVGGGWIAAAIGTPEDAGR